MSPFGYLPFNFRSPFLFITIAAFPPSSSITSGVGNLLHLHPSNNPRMVLVSNVFNGSGFGSWKHMITIAHSVKNKLGFINRESERPEETSSDLQHWQQCNNMVISWILNTLSKEISKSVLYSTTMKKFWSELEELFC